MKTNFKDLAICLLVCATLGSCDLGDEVDKYTTMEDVGAAAPTIKENIQVQGKVIEVFENVNNLVSISPSKSAFLNSDPVVTEGDNHTFTLDFAYVPNASGKIIVAFSGVPLFTTSNLTATITFQDYIKDGMKMEGTIKLVLVNYKRGWSAEFNYSSVDKLTITEEGDKSYTTLFNYTIDWSEGINTFGVSSDNAFLFSGSSTQEIEGVTNLMDITQSLVYYNSCDYTKEGVIDFTIKKDSKDEIKISCDFGVNADGELKSECDSYVKLSAGSFSSIISVN